MFEYSLSVAEVRKNQQFGSPFKTVYVPVRLTVKGEEVAKIWCTYDGRDFATYRENPFEARGFIYAATRVRRAHMYVGPLANVARALEYLYSLEPYLTGEIKMTQTDFENLYKEEQANAIK